MAKLLLAAYALLHVVVNATTIPVIASRQQQQPQSCNGSPTFCSRKYSNVSLIGTHDSAFVGSILDPRVNQEESGTQQLEAGIRFLQAQVHDFDGELSMCHTSCLELYAGSLQQYLEPVKIWLDGNPNEVITMLLVNGDHNSPADFDAVFSAVGLKDYAFVPASSPATLAFDDWPTYAQIIASGTRLILFLDSGANTTGIPYILPEFSYFFETPYDTTDPSFPQCSLNRPPNSSPEGKMYIVNHFLDRELFADILIPDNSADFATNAATGNGSIGAQVTLCEGVYGRVPNLVLVDMFDRGDVFAAQRVMNGL
jgi:hypothetical protein